VDIKRKRSRKRARTAPLALPGRDNWLLFLYIAGRNLKGITALNNLKLICDEQLNGKYRLEVIDLLKHPRLARENQIVAIPTLVRKLPRPVRNIIGDLSNTERVLAGLDLVERCAL
jgi:circadian clock protein KaiB